MTSADRNDLVPAQEKLEWVTPKISLMEAGDALGNKMNVTSENWAVNFGFCGPLAVNGCGAS